MNKQSLSSHNYNLQELPSLRNYNSKTFYIPGKTNEKIILAPWGKYKSWGGELLTEFHVKPIHYVGVDRKWHDMSEIASWFGNKKGMILKDGWENKVDFGYLVWYLKRQKLINGRGIRVGIEQGIGIKKLEIPVLLNVVSTFYPDPNVEVTSVDGYVQQYGGSNDWATLVAAAGNGAGDADAAPSTIYYDTNATTNKFVGLIRGILLYDTSALTASATISAATNSIQGSSKADGMATTPNSDVYGSTPASNTALVGADFAQTQNTSFTGAPVTYANWSTTAYNDYVFNATGIAAISKTAVTKTSWKNASYDVANTQPAWAASTSSYLAPILADTAGTATDPKLVVTFTLPGGASPLSNMLLMGV